MTPWPDTINANGGFRYDPRNVAVLQRLKATETASDTFTYTISDGKGGVSTATATVLVQGENDAPVAINDSYRVDEDSTLIVSGQGVIENDFDPDGDIITVATYDVTSALGAPVTVNADGTFSYDPTGIATVQALPAGQSLTDTFTYGLTDGATQSNQAVVTITVDGRNDAPIARNDTYTVVEDGSLVVSSANGVLNNPATGDRDPEGSPLTATLVASPANGSLALGAAGGVTYTPNPNFSGVDTFTYRARDGSLSSDLATVTIVVTPVNDNPVANPDSYSVNQEGTLTVPAIDGVLANDTDVDGEQLTAVRVAGTGPTHGTLQLAGNGSFTYTPNRGYFGDDTFQYDAVDGAGVRSRATVTISVENIHNWQNPANRFDVNADGFVSPQDVLIIINYINTFGPGPVPPNAVGPPFRDVNGDDLISSADVLALINFINASSAFAEGEGEGEGAGFAAASGLPGTVAEAVDQPPIIVLTGMASGHFVKLPESAAAGELDASAGNDPQAVDALFGNVANSFAPVATRIAPSTVQSVDASLDSLLEDWATDDLASDVGKAWEEDLLGHHNP